MSNVPLVYAPTGFNYVKEVTFRDISAASTTKVIDLFQIPADGLVAKVGYYIAPGQFFDGGATSTMTVQVGVTGTDTDYFVAASVVHVDGTEISSAINTGAAFNDATTANTINFVAYDAASTSMISALFTATGGNTDVLTQGKIVFFAEVVNFSGIK